MDLMKLGASLLSNVLGDNQDDNGVMGALGKLLGGDGEGAEGGLNLQALVDRMMGSETSDSLTEIAQSWLGDGENAPISTDQVKELIGEDKISEVAQELGQDENSLAETLTQVLPQLVDKSSSGGSLLDSLGGAGGIADMLGNFLRK